MKHIVAVADMKWSSHLSDELATYGLGSCLGVTAYDPVSRVAGMLHVMLPAAEANPEKAENNPFMFVDTGIPEFLAQLEAAGMSRHRCRLKVAGGASLTPNDHFAIGRRNYVALRKLLWKFGILIESEDVGGSMARTIHLDVDTGRVRVLKSGRQSEL